MACICVWFLAIAVRLDLTNCRKFPAYLRKFANCKRYGNHAHSYESSVSYRVVVGVSESVTTEAMMAQSALEFCPIHCPNGRLGQDLQGFGGIAIALKLPELLNRNFAAVRAKLGQRSCFPNGPQIWCPIGQSIGFPAGANEHNHASSPLIGLAKWAPFIALNFCCLGLVYMHTHARTRRPHPIGSDRHIAVM